MIRPNRHPSARQQQRLGRYIHDSDSYAFFNLLTGPRLLTEVEALLPDHRERLFPPTETLSMFLAQVLSADGSCRQAVDEAAVKRLVGGLDSCSTSTSAYCQARARLPTAMVSTRALHVGAMIGGDAPSWWYWQGRRVRRVDGATVTLADTAESQEAYPQPSSQKPGLGFLQCRVVGLFCLGSGALLNTATAPCEGKGSDEQTLLRGMLDTLEPGFLLGAWVSESCRNLLMFRIALA